MCGRVIVDYDEIMPVAADSELAAWMTEKPEAASSWNLKPTDQLPLVLTSPRDGVRRFTTAHWSLIPPWSPSMRTKYPTFNARAENLAEKATFKASVKNRRCVIPLSGFYEWSGPKGSRTPHAIFGPEKVLPLAGLYGWWRSPDGKWHLTVTILTRDSSGVMAPLHPRMPVFMDRALLSDWLDPDTEGDQSFVDAVSDAAVPLAERLRAYRVDPLRGDGPHLITPAV